MKKLMHKKYIYNSNVYAYLAKNANPEGLVSFWDFNKRTQDNEEPNLHGALSLFAFGDVEYLRSDWLPTYSLGRFDPSEGVYLKNAYNAEIAIQDLSTEFTMEVMVRTPVEGSSSWQAVAGRWSDRWVNGHRGKHFLLNYYPEEERFVGFIGDGSFGHQAVWNEEDHTCQFTGKRGVVNDRWYHVVLRYDGSGIGDDDKLQLWIDGDLLCNERTSGIPSSIHQPPHAVPFTIGAHFDDYGNAAHHFAGEIDYVRVYSKALEEDEISWLYLNRSQEYFGSYFKFLDGVDP